MACSSTPLAAVVGRDILKAGGNAADAALAMAAVVNVTEPMMSGLGGDMFAMVWKDGKVHGLNSSGRSGSLMTLERVRAEHGDVMPHAGAATVNVPGALDGYLELHRKFGTMELTDLFESAAALVDGGFPVGQKIAQAWAAGSALLRKFSPGSTDYLPGGNVPAPGALFRQPDLAALWRRIAREGRSAFYAGEVRDRIVETVAKQGGYLEAADFDTIQAEWVEPIRGAYRGHTVLEMPPNGQGIVALEALAIVAYRQPILRADLESIRGVACGEVLRSLMERRLVKIVGRADEVGRPMLYGTTTEFLKQFGIGKLDELPNAKDLK
jgi:gamma-glutamyltranspeptidase/glutathione hydrolase